MTAGHPIWGNRLSTPSLKRTHSEDNDLGRELLFNLLPFDYGADIFKSVPFVSAACAGSTAVFLLPRKSPSVGEPGDALLFG